jgi:AraC-like DNA-binding protein
MHTNGKSVVEALTNSRIFLDYSQAFGDMTGLPVTLRPVDSWQLPYHGRPNENPYCALVAQKSMACAMCLQTQQHLSEIASVDPQTLTCASGLCETAIPVKLGEQLVGFLQTGQVFRKKPNAAQCDRVAKLVSEWGLEADPEKLRRLYLETRVVSQREHEAIVKMMSIFAQHLSLVSNQVVVRQEHSEPAMIARAKEFIQEHQGEDLNLTQVAKAVNTSTFYFCKVFKKTTGINFTDYVSRVRIERAKNLALNPNLRISEIAFEVGFQSLTHFNRVFKKITGLSPTEYRAQLPTT